MLFSVVTATYNRSHTIHRVFESLQAQTFKDFEWIVVDDGSTDNTAQIVRNLRSDFPIHYEWKPNGGKHTAMNVGVNKAKGYFILFMDSDDRCTPNALMQFHHHWNQIRDPERFSSLSCLAMWEDGTVIGEMFPDGGIDAFTLKEQLRYRSSGDRWGINRSDLLKNCLFPTFEGEHFLPEGLVWNRLSSKYATRFVNEKLLIVHRGDDNLSYRTVELRESSPRGTLTYYAELASSQASIATRIRATLNFIRFCPSALRYFLSAPR
jgi:glycosyltransferase involved in cell wall biosynthesis